MTETWTGKPYLALLASKEEDRFTEYLCHLLQSDDVCRAFLEQLCDVEPPEGPLHVATQVTVEGGRPDLAIRGEELYVLFEAKVASLLHESQLKPYAADLSRWKDEHPNGQAALFLLCPARVAGGQQREGGASLADGEIELPVITWERVADLCSRIAADVSDKRLAVHLEEFSLLVDNRIGTLARPFTAEEMAILDDPLAPQLLARLRSLVQLVRDSLLREEGDAFTVSTSTGIAFDGYTLKRDGRWWWFGFWPGAWLSVGSPLVFQTPGFRDRVPPHLPNGLVAPIAYSSPTSNGHAVPLSLRADVELEQLAEEYAAVIRRYCHDVPGSGVVA